jgi:2-polyprenyl-3-methyl-5-hydroxy-6-metoxy-1,4-benzoquinol methylase
MNRGCCPSHPGAEAQALFSAADPISREGFEVVQCPDCSLARTSPQPSPDELDRYYPAGYHGASKRYRLGLDRSLSVIHRNRIRRIERLTGGPGRVLDVGCGPGRLLDQMRRRGWETRGTERSAGAAQVARDVLNLDVRAQDLDELLAEGVSYDAVVLWHVAEHVHDPATTLLNIARLLRPGGVLMVAVPNFGSPEAKIGKSAWFHLDVPRHLFHFTPATLRNLLVEAALEPREVVHAAPEYDILSFVQTMQNRIGLPANLLYDVLRRPQARLTHLGGSSLLSLVAVASSFPLALAGFLWAPVAAALGLSATITIYAQRPATVVRD